jgi:hypothetical protein
VGGFSFRLACYDGFHWTPDVVRSLSESEAAMLAIYFEETGRYQALLNKKRRQPDKEPASTNVLAGGEWVDDFEFKDDDWDDD